MGRAHQRAARLRAAAQKRSTGYVPQSNTPPAAGDSPPVPAVYLPPFYLAERPRPAARLRLLATPGDRLAAFASEAWGNANPLDADLVVVAGTSMADVTLANELSYATTTRKARPASSTAGHQDRSVPRPDDRLHFSNVPAAAQTIQRIIAIARQPASSSDTW